MDLANREESSGNDEKNFYSTFLILYHENYFIKYKLNLNKKRSDDRLHLYLQLEQHPFKFLTRNPLGLCLPIFRSSSISTNPSSPHTSPPRRTTRIKTDKSRGPEKVKSNPRWGGIPQRAGRPLRPTSCLLSQALLLHRGRLSSRFTTCQSRRRAGGSFSSQAEGMMNRKSGGLQVASLRH